MVLGILTILAESRKTIARSLVFQICQTQKVIAVQIHASISNDGKNDENVWHSVFTEHSVITHDAY